MGRVGRAGHNTAVAATPPVPPVTGCFVLFSFLFLVVAFNPLLCASRGGRGDATRTARSLRRGDISFVCHTTTTSTSGRHRRRAGGTSSVVVLVLTAIGCCAGGSGTGLKSVVVVVVVAPRNRHVFGT